MIGVGCRQPGESRDKVVDDVGLQGGGGTRVALAGGFHVVEALADGPADLLVHIAGQGRHVGANPVDDGGPVDSPGLQRAVCVGGQGPFQGGGDTGPFAGPNLGGKLPGKLAAQSAGPHWVPQLGFERAAIRSLGVM